MGKIIAICISEKRGTEKKNIGECNIIEGFGLENDAHGGKIKVGDELICLE